MEGAWATGQRAIELLRMELGGEADNLVPLTGGGVSLHKIRGVVHDTCLRNGELTMLSPLSVSLG